MEIADPTLEALVDASNFPLSIVMIGVGDGPWGLMEDCDDLLPSRKFDNFQVIFNTVQYVNSLRLQAEIVETTFVRSRFLDIQHGYDFVPNRIQKKRPERTVV